MQKTRSGQDFENPKPLLRKGARDNRDMSEGLEKSRPNILGDGLVQMDKIDSQSQKDFVVLKKQS